MRSIDPGRAALLVALALAAFVFFPITRNYFRADDFGNLQWVVNFPLLRWIFQPQAGHVYMVRNTLFFLSYEAFGPQPTYFYWTALLTHLLNVGLLFAVIRRFTESVRLAYVGAVAWGISPAQVVEMGRNPLRRGFIAASLATLPDALSAFENEVMRRSN